MSAALDDPPSIPGQDHIEQALPVRTIGEPSEA